MTYIRQETRLDLDRHDLVELCAPGRHTLHCESGEVWITFDGSREDVVLAAGASLDLDGRRGVVVSALRPARLSLSAPPSGVANLLERGRAPWHWARSLRWKFPALASFPATHLR